MVITYNKGHKVPISANFNSTDFDCHCKRDDCQQTDISTVLVQALETLRSLAGGFTIDSGFRCPAHNAEVGGAAGSQHLLGLAADCRSATFDGAEMARRAEGVPSFLFGGIGTYDAFAHCDVRGHKARWDYRTLC